MLDDVLRSQRGMVSRRQARAAGMSDAAIRANVRAGRWRRVYEGVYATFTGELSRASLYWAVVLRIGPDAVLSHETAAELTGLIDAGRGPVHVTVPHQRRRVRLPGVTVHRSDRGHHARHPSRLPPRTRLDDTVVDLAQAAACLDDAIGWLSRAVGSRLTTVERLADTLRARPRVRWRGALASALGDIGAGCHSPLEVRYLRDVERAHGLPTADRQTRTGAGYDDVHYRAYETVVELDGRVAHPTHDRFRDMRRDNASVVSGRRVLRYGWADIDGYPCQVAVQVGRVLTTNGWTGRVRPCRRPGCEARP